MAAYLKAREIDTVYIVGIATDFCVAWTAIDACELGFSTYVIEDATKGIDLNGSLEQAWQQMLAHGVQRVRGGGVGGGGRVGGEGGGGESQHLLG